MNHKESKDFPTLSVSANATLQAKHTLFQPNVNSHLHHENIIREVKHLPLRDQNCNISAIFNIAPLLDNLFGCIFFSFENVLIKQFLVYNL